MHSPIPVGGMTLDLCWEFLPMAGLQLVDIKMTKFFARLFNLFTIFATIVFFGGVILMNVSPGGGEKYPFFIFIAIWFGLIAGLNYLVFGRPTIWNLEK